MIEPERLSGLGRLADHFAARKERAAARLAGVSGRHFYFAILGLESKVEDYDFSSMGRWQRVTEPPGEVELAAALSNKSIFGAIGRYSHGVRYELVIDRDFCSTDQGAMDHGWWIISALRVRTLAAFLVPAVSDHSWSTIAGVTDGTCYAQLLEDVPQARRFGKSAEVTTGDLDWVGLHLAKFSELLEVPRFRLAVESLTTHHFEFSERMAAATLWAGIEALFGIQIELRFRLATLIASLLEPRGETRRDLYRRVKKLYDTRSLAVHGGSLPEGKIAEHIVEVRKLLSRLLCQFVELGKMPAEQEFEDMVFC